MEAQTRYMLSIFYFARKSHMDFYAKIVNFYFPKNLHNRF